MTHKFKVPIRLLSAFIAMLFILYVYPPAALAEEPAITEALTYEPEFEAITAEELASLYEAEEQPEATVIGEKTDLRDATVKHYRMSDGTFRAVDYGSAVHFKDDSGEWTDFDNDLVLNETVDSSDSEDFAGYEPEKNDVKIKFAKNTSSSNLLKIKYEDFRISFGIRDANKSAPVIENGEADPTDPYAVPGVTSKITYPEVFDGVDLVYIVDGNNVKEYFVISEDATVFEYTFDIKVKNVVPSVDEDGNVVFTKDDGTVVYTIPKGYMYDSGMGYSDAVTYTVEQVKNKKYTLTITADEQWITDEERVYPVTVDPTVVVNKYDNLYNENISLTGYNTYEGETPNREYVYVGCAGTAENTHITYTLRAHVTDLIYLPENSILCEAYFALYQNGYSTQNLENLYVGAYEPDATNLYARGANSPMLDYAVYSTSSNGTFSRFDVTSAARKWYAYCVDTGDTANPNYNSIVLEAINNDIDANTYAWVNLAECNSVFSELINEQPRFIVTYRHTVGIENYYTYETLGAGRAGTVYLNVNTGQTTLVKDILTTNNLATPYTVSLIYNSAYAGALFTNRIGYDDTTATNYVDIHTADYSRMYIGNGWKLNSQISVTKLSIGDIIYLVYCDADGTEHYFANSGTLDGPTQLPVYKDEDGLGLKIIYNKSNDTETYVLTDDYDNKTVFDIYGYVAYSMDSNGNKITYTYDVDEDIKQLLSISVENNGGVSKTIATFTYDTNNCLSSITDEYNKTTVLSRRTSTSPAFSSELTRVTHPDSTTVTYGSDSTNIQVVRDDENSYALRFAYEDNGTGSTVRETAKDDSTGSTRTGARVSFEYVNDEKTVVTYSGNDGTLDTTDDIKVVYLFDNMGRCVNSHTIEAGSDTVIGASTVSYTSPSDTLDRTVNRIDMSASIGIQPVNLLMNSGAEEPYSDASKNIASHFYRKSLDYLETVARSTTVAHTGNASMMVSASTASDTETYTSYIISGLTVNQKYTFSAYAKGTNISTTTTSGGYYIHVGDDYSAIINKSINESIDNGWVKLSVTFTATTDGAIYLKAGMKNATGTVYFDDFQLVSYSDPAQVSLIPDGGLDNSSCFSFADYTGVSYSTDNAISGIKSLKIIGSPYEIRKAEHIVNIYKPGANTYVLSGWAKGNSVYQSGDTKPEGKTPFFGLKALITYTDNTTSDNWIKAPFSDDIEEWQFVSVPIIPNSDKTVKTITVALEYDYNANTAHFDNISLVADNATTYKYDENGNVEAVNSTNQPEVSATYSGADLTGYTAANGAEYTYGYDSAHNLIAATWAGVANTYAYNSAGLVTGSYLRNGTNVITTTAAYDNYGKLTSETDQLGNATSYTYNEGNGTLSKATYPDGSEMVYETNTSNNRSTKTYYNVPGTGYESEIAFSYSDGRLSQISQTPSGSTTSQSYNLEYDIFGNMTKLTVGDITLSENVYSEYTGALLRSLTPGGATLRYSHDNLGRVIGGAIDETVFFRTAYNSTGNIASQTDIPRNIITSFLYDSLGRTTNVMHRSTDNVLQQLNSYFYDDANRLTKRTYDFDFYTGLSDYFTYDSNGLLSKMVPANGDNLIPEYNGFKQISKVKIEHENSANYTFSKGYTYKELSTTRKTNLPIELSYVKESDSTNLLTFAYTYDNMNNITEVYRQSGTAASSLVESYTYDDYGKLTYANVNGNQYTYTYDKTGNITNIAKIENEDIYNIRLVYDTVSGWRDRLVSVNNTAITYSDTAPGLPVEYYNTKKSYEFTWNDLGQLYGGLVDGKAVTYQYNTDGLRTFKWANNQNHYYYYDGDRLIAEKLTTGYLLFYYDENDSIYSITYNNGTTSTKYYLYKNLQGDVVQIRDKYNAVVANYSYDAWGNLVVVTSATGADITSNTSHIAYINPIRYRGYYYDTETGFYYLQSRYYDPAIGRFISADTLMVNSPAIYGYNLFAYCGNDPVTGYDPSGYYSWGEFWNDAYDGVCSLVDGTVDLVNGAVDFVGAAVSSFSFEFECGMGIGVSANIGNAVEVEALAVINRDKLKVNENGFEDYREMEFSADITIADTITIGPSAVYSVDLDEVHESNSFYTNPNGKWDTSWNAEMNNTELGNDAIFSIGARGYFIFGVGIELGFNFTKFFEKVGDIG